MNFYNKRFWNISESNKNIFAMILSQKLYKKKQKQIFVPWKCMKKHFFYTMKLCDNFFFKNEDTWNKGECNFRFYLKPQEIKPQKK